MIMRAMNQRIRESTEDTLFQTGGQFCPSCVIYDNCLMLKSKILQKKNADRAILKEMHKNSNIVIKLSCQN